MQNTIKHVCKLLKSAYVLNIDFQFYIQKNDFFTKIIYFNIQKLEI